MESTWHIEMELNVDTTRLGINHQCNKYETILLTIKKLFRELITQINKNGELELNFRFIA